MSTPLIPTITSAGVLLVLKTAGRAADLSAISNVATFLDLDAVKPASQGGGGLTYLDPLDCPEFEVEISGSAIA